MVFWAPEYAPGWDRKYFSLRPGGGAQALRLCSIQNYSCRFSVVGIENISLYDPAGELKQNQDTLLIKLNEKLKE